MKAVSQIAEYATLSIWGNPTVTCVGSNAGVWSLQDNMEMLEVLSERASKHKKESLITGHLKRMLRREQ